MRLTTISRTQGGGPFATTRRLSSTWASGAAIAALLLIFLLDHGTGSAPFQHLYYVPIIFAGVRFGKRGGVAAACTTSRANDVADHIRRAVNEAAPGARGDPVSRHDALDQRRRDLAVR
jgi:hypothetical protein